ncbi:hypothetical protein [Polaribacter atrinae]|uniref:Uncharacterized protein n=1 Tax=Polaribacter atrinae TaxID=1333662 RepID=A0A176TDX9_9FLAO|nr:hypothetical protein [Polaribacter atrinae]OAD45733.1 hypothetical protein LPB303_05450 [Polaribacter atrinae]
MYRQNKSHLTYQAEGRLSSYLSDIGDCDEFSSNSKSVFNRTMKMTECIHSLLEHIRANCISDNKNLLINNYLTIDKEVENQIQYNLTWTPFKSTKKISGFLKITFLTPDLTLCKTSNFKSDSIEGLTNLIIDLTTLTFANRTSNYEQNLYVVKTKDIEELSKDELNLLKSELVSYCDYNGLNLTFLYIKHKDNVGHYHKHFSNYE